MTKPNEREPNAREWDYVGDARACVDADGCFDSQECARLFMAHTEELLARFERVAAELQSGSAYSLPLWCVADSILAAIEAARKGEP